MATVFDEIITSGVRSGQVPARTQAARDWYRATASEYKRISEGRFTSDKSRQTTKIMPGSMYMFHYDPKYKETLPFYDRFPLIFPFKVSGGHFWGLNLHYLPPQGRALLMNNLYELTNNKRYDESTRLRLSYDVLNGASKFKHFKPCVKQYLFSHVDARFIYIYPSEWDIAIFLPTERFKKSSKQTVWQHSSAVISGRQ